MASIVNRLIDRLYPGRKTQNVTIFGLDYSGKTTLLYLLKLGEIMQTVGTLGSNIETFDVTTASGKTLNLTAFDIGTGCGIRYISGLIRVYIHISTALIWVVDATDRARLPESVQALRDSLATIDGDDVLKGKTLPILILANKSDKPEAMKIDEIRMAFAKLTSGRLASVFKTALNGHTSLNMVASGLPEAFDWLSVALAVANSGKPADAAAMESALPHPTVREQSSLAHKLESWLYRSEEDMTHEEFLEKFWAFNLPEWDHYTHIRVAYVILTKYGRREGKD